MNHEKRMLLWKNTINLFHNYKKIDYEGPFYKSGYTDYRIEVPINDKKTGKVHDIDIIACNRNKSIIVELTCNDKSKKSIMEIYSNLDSRDLAYLGMASKGNFEVISSRLYHIDDGEYCQIIVNDIFNVINDNFIKDNELHKAITAFKGQNMKKLPEIPISFVPESQNEELRCGLVDIIMQLFEPGSSGMTSTDMCEAGLERLYNKTSPGKRQSISQKIKKEVDLLVEKDLRDYIMIDECQRYVPRTDKIKYPKSRESIKKILYSWAYQTQIKLDQYIPEQN